MIVDFREKKTTIIINSEPIERLDGFKFPCTIISSDLGWKKHRCNPEKGSTQGVLPVARKDIQAEEGDSCSVLSFCY